MSAPDPHPTENADTRLPHRGEPPTAPIPLSPARRHERSVIGSHLILHGYGHWLPNDPRGSGSHELREEKLTDLGPIHHGRKRVQPPRSELREFYRAAEPRLDFPLVWFDDAKRQAIGESFARVVASRRYTLWACAVLKNHAHLCVRRHRDDPVTIWRAFADASASALRGAVDVSSNPLRRFAECPDDHPVWSNRPYKVFLKSTDDVRRVVAYIEQNPAKEGLAAQSWPFITPYDGWPHARSPAR